MNQLCKTSLFTKREHSLIFSSLKKSSFLKSMLLINFPIQWYLNILNLYNILMMLNKCIIWWFSFYVTTRSQWLDSFLESEIMLRVKIYKYISALIRLRLFLRLLCLSFFSFFLCLFSLFLAELFSWHSFPLLKLFVYICQ